MNYSEIRSRFMEANNLMYETLLHVMKNLPENMPETSGIILNNTIDYERQNFKPVVLMEDQCSGDRNLVTVDKLTLVDDTMYYDCHFTYLECKDLIEDVEVDCYDGETCKELLDAIKDEVMLKIKPFYPKPQTILVTGYQACNMADNLTSEEEAWELMEALEDTEITRRPWIMDNEREAYKQGCKDIDGHIDATFIDNSDGKYDI